MTITKSIGLVVLSITLLNDAPGISIAPFASVPQTPTDYLQSHPSTQSRAQCARRGQDCMFRTCCDNRYCRQNESDDATCR